MAEEAAVASTPPQSSAPPLGSTVIPSQKERQSNNWTMDSSGSAVGRKESGTVPPLDKTRGDESCIIVNEAELHYHPHRQGKKN
ncbi:hypothetical protein PVK06_044238 [Gossypium arboreum]|uniref:Uncharacterized protein n=1 Tax=Gossypium arboreum TaxID=29729 RepID=A0ABR0MQL3_GOSAR|nr:hypothetical protein PVK06_044238 [Gossypium arboreum]